MTGSGKTTYARRRLEPSGAVRLSVDERVHDRHGRYGVDALILSPGGAGRLPRRVRAPRRGRGDHRARLVLTRRRGRRVARWRPAGWPPVGDGSEGDRPEVQLLSGLSRLS
ncbi:hypothetical protein [Streptomyces sp. NPDC002553]|uniref:hypothetical protein n=1 Tax=Streptomyces sp. NPDC002553 TaxID=3154417 RepID=UPI003320F10D